MTPETNSAANPANTGPAFGLDFDTLLVANRGEIALRIIRTARELGLRTVAVYSEADATAPHTRAADVAVDIGGADPAESYLSIDAILRAAAETGAGAIHPGYGFLSEKEEFAERVEAAGMRFVGPTAEQLRVFGDKHTARQAAEAVGVPLIAGTGLLEGPEHAAAEAERIGFPVIVKAVGGGGGIGLQVCESADEVRAAFDRVVRLSENHFSSSGVFLERFVSSARHVEVQVCGDGLGNVATLGTRDCSLQRRNQKVVEEAPAPALPAEIEAKLLETSRLLAESVSYRSAGTVEFVFDAEHGEASFLEMNTRLQVEHPVTEAVTGVDLVEWMLRIAGGDTAFLAPLAAEPPAVTGHAVEARVYAEDPAGDYRPCPGSVSGVHFPTAARVDGWIEAGTEVSPFYDPLLAKIIVSAADRSGALDALDAALAETAVYGLTTNLGQLREAARLEDFVAASHSTSTLKGVEGRAGRIDVERPGTSTTVQDLPGRTGLWNVGIPPSGPMDSRSFAAANRLVGNAPGAPALECTLHGPRLRFSTATRVAVAGAPVTVLLDDESAEASGVIDVPAGSVLDVSAPTDAGLRTYVAVAGGIESPRYLGSASTFALGGFGGPFGRELRVGDVLHAAPASDAAGEGAGADQEGAGEIAVSAVTHEWTLAVAPGPQASEDYIVPGGLDVLFEAEYRVGGHANRTGIRLEGPAPEWSRADGGDAGLHPSNLHDNPYSIGALNMSGDTPILLGPDGPSLGGFVCPVTVVSGDRWKLGQLRPGDAVRFVLAGSDQEPMTAEATPTTSVEASSSSDSRRPAPDDGVLLALPETAERPGVRYQRGGDDNLLVEYGEMELDLGLRMRVHALTEAIEAAGIPGIVDATPGVRSLHLHIDPDQVALGALADRLAELEDRIGATRDLEVPSRHIRLPLSFDDPSIEAAMERYRRGVRDEAPWLPSNLEFIRRINGLDSIDEVRDIVFDAEYLVLGLGDVYLGAPLAVPLDPRHRLATTKYNPARTWTPSDAVGIGGKYLCVYGMESPGGYQLIGRTLPIWSTHRQPAPFDAGKPWLFRYFDRISWEPVSAAELETIRAETRAGTYRPEITEGRFSVAEHERFLAENAADIAAVDEVRRAAFDAEKQAWSESGELERFAAGAEPEAADAGAQDKLDVPEGASVLMAPMTGNVWKVESPEGADVAAGDTIAVLEAMKLELPLQATAAGKVLSVLVEPGARVQQGTPVAVIGAA